MNSEERDIEELAKISQDICESDGDEDMPKSAKKPVARSRSKTPPRLPALAPQAFVVPEHVKKAAKEKEKEDRETERLRLYKLCTNYLTNPIFSKYLQNIALPKPNASLEELRAVLEAVKQSKNGRRKRIFVDQLFGTVTKAIETGLVHLAHVPEADGLDEFIHLPPNIEMFDEDLEEISIELPDKYVPSAKIRIAVTMANLVQEFIKLKKEMSNPDRYPSGDAPRQN